MPFDSIIPSDPQLVGSQLIGTAGGRYRLESLLGTGALGVVYLARQEPLGRQVAVKFLREPYASDPRFAAALQREARAGCRIEHNNVTRTYDVGYDQHGRCFLVMELLRGAPLETVVQNVPRPPLEWTVSIVSQVLAGLAAAHERGVVHRDVKPSNVMIETTLNDDDEPVDIAKLCDFGISEIADRDAYDAGADEGFDSSACGTPNYMAPEQALRQQCTPQSDIYSCGVMLFELATGRLPFEGSTPQVTASRHVYEAPPQPRSLCRDISPALQRIIVRALAKRPSQRFASARQMRAALLALPEARRSTSLLDSWADAPTPHMPVATAERTPAPVRSLWKPFTRPQRKPALRPALLGAAAMTLGAAVVCQQLPQVEAWLGAERPAQAQQK